MQRRRFVLTGVGVVVAAGLSGCDGRLHGFTTLRDARQRVLDLRFNTPRHDSPWSLSQLLQHLAQSVEYSVRGYPEMKSAVLRAVLGNAAFAVFNARGKISHSLTEPIPGAPPLDGAVPLKDAVQRLLDALDLFERHSGALRPHFAYGELDKAQYTRVHLMHLADHWGQLRFLPKSA